MTPEPEMGRKPPARGMQRIFTSAARASWFIVENDSCGNEYGFLMRVTSALSWPVLEEEAEEVLVCGAGLGFAILGFLVFCSVLEA